MNSRIVIVVLGLLFLCLLASRFCLLEADPDTTLTGSNTFLGDEGRNAGNASVKYLTDDWESAPNHIVLMPVVPVIQYAVYNIVGHTFWVPRAVTAIFTCILIILMAFFLIKNCDHDTRLKPLLLFMFLIGSNHYLFVYGRLALLDVPGVTLAMLVLFLFHKILNDKNNSKLAGYIILTVAIALALLTRTQALSALLAIALTLLLRSIQERQLEKNTIGIFMLCAVVGITMYWLGLQAAEWHTGITESANIAISSRYNWNPKVIISNYLHLGVSRLILVNIGLYAVATLGVAITLLKVLKKKTVTNADLIMASYLIAHCLQQGFFEYQPPRWLLATIIPVIYFSSKLPFEIAKNIQSTRIRNSLSIALLIAVIVGNAWNIKHLSSYIASPNYSFQTVAMQVKDDILKDAGDRDQSSIIMYGEITPHLGLVNQLRSQFNPPPAQHEQAIYILSQEPIDEKNKAVHLLSSYDVLNNYTNMRLYLYRED